MPQALILLHNILLTFIEKNTDLGIGEAFLGTTPEASLRVLLCRKSSVPRPWTEFSLQPTTLDQPKVHIVCTETQLIIDSD